MVTMQKAAETQDEGGVTENTDTEDSVDEEEKADAETMMNLPWKTADR